MGEPVDEYRADADIYAYDRSQQPMVRYARLVLVALIALNVLAALMIAAVFLGGAVLDQSLTDQEMYGMVASGVCTPLTLLFVGVLPAALASVGLGRGAKWGWFLTLAVGVINIVPCCTCLPVGLFLVYAMLSDDVRQAFADA